jgi:hypothetical protein
VRIDACEQPTAAALIRELYKVASTAVEGRQQLAMNAVVEGVISV